MRRYCQILIGITIILVIGMHSSYISARIIIATGSKTGTYYKVCNDIKEIAEKNGILVDVIESKGSFDNVDLMLNGKTDLAIVQSDLANYYKVDPDFFNKIRVIFPLFKEELHVFANNRIKGLNDLKRKKFFSGNQQSGTWLTIATIFHKVYLTDIKEIYDLAYQDAIIKVLTNEIDGMAWVGGKPLPLFQKLGAEDCSPEFKKMLNHVHFVPIRTVPLGNYYTSTIGPEDYSWVQETTPTIAVKAFLVSCNNPKKQNVTDSELIDFVKIVKDNIAYLNEHGHAKWKEIDLSVDVDAPWKFDPRAKYGGAVDELRNMFK